MPNIGLMRFRRGWMCAPVTVALACASSHENEAEVRDVPAVCADEGGTGIGALAPLADDVVAASFGPCGHLEYRDADRGQWLLDPSFTAPAFLGTTSGTGQFSPAGDRLAFVETDAESSSIQIVHLDAEGTERAAVPEPGRLMLLRTARGDTLAFHCADDTLTALDATLGHVSVVGHLDCSTLETSLSGGSLIGWDSTGSLHHLDAGDPSTTVVQSISTEDRGEVFGAEPWSEHGVHMSPDGSVLFHRRSRFEVCGDTVCGLGSTVTVVDANVDSVLRTVESPLPECCGDNPFGVYASNGGGRSALLDEAGGGVWVQDEALRATHVSGWKGEHLLDGGVHALVRVDDESVPPNTLRLVDVRSPATVPLEAELDPPSSVILSARETHIALRYSECAQTMEPCEGGIVVWHVLAEGAAREVMRVVSDDIPLGVSDEGVVVAVRDHSDPARAGLVLVQPDGSSTLIVPGAPASPSAYAATRPERWWGPGSYPSLLKHYSVWFGNESAVVRLGLDDEARTMQLWAIAIDSGRAELLAAAPRVDVWVDRAAERLAYLTREGLLSPGVLTAGALPVPR